MIETTVADGVETVIHPYSTHNYHRCAQCGHVWSRKVKRGWTRKGKTVTMRGSAECPNCASSRFDATAPAVGCDDTSLLAREENKFCQFCIEDHRDDCLALTYRTSKCACPCDTSVPDLIGRTIESVIEYVSKEISDE